MLYLVTCFAWGCQVEDHSWGQDRSKATHCWVQGDSALPQALIWRDCWYAGVTVVCWGQERRDEQRADRWAAESTEGSTMGVCLQRPWKSKHNVRGDSEEETVALTFSRIEPRFWLQRCWFQRSSPRGPNFHGRSQRMIFPWSIYIHLVRSLYLFKSGLSLASNHHLLYLYSREKSNGSLLKNEITKQGCRQPTVPFLFCRLLTNVEVVPDKSTA